MFSRDFAIPQQGKSKETFKNKGQKGSICGASAAAFLGGSWELFGASLGFPWASVLIVHQHSKIAHLLPFGAIAFLDCFQISVLRAFLGGLFGFIGFRCIFGWLVAFVGLVGLYACRVKRLRT